MSEYDLMEKGRHFRPTLGLFECAVLGPTAPVSVALRWRRLTFPSEAGDLRSDEVSALRSKNAGDEGQRVAVLGDLAESQSLRELDGCRIFGVHHGDQPQRAATTKYI